MNINNLRQDIKELIPDQINAFWVIKEKSGKGFISNTKEHVKKRA